MNVFYLTAAKKAPKGKDEAKPAPKEAAPKEAPAQPPKGETMLLWGQQNVALHPPGSSCPSAPTLPSLL